MWHGSDPALMATPDAAVAPTGQMPEGHPGTATEPSAAGLSGTVAEVIQVDSYTYLKLTRSGAEPIWAAVPKTEIGQGETVHIVDATLMTGFESKTLGRRFDEIYFGTLGSGAAGDGAMAGLPAGHPAVPGGADPHGGMPQGHPAAADNGAPHQTPGAKVESGDVPRAEGGLTVAEIHAQAAEQAGKTVTLAARVTKVTPEVLGKTWLHVQDGSGDPARGTHDLVVTTAATPTVGDTVVLTGTLVRDKDLGSGYRYDVLLEDASITTP